MIFNKKTEIQHSYNLSHNDHFSREQFARAQTQSLYYKILSATLNLVSGDRSIDTSILYNSANTSFKGGLGVFHYIIEASIKQTKYFLQIKNNSVYQLSKPTDRDIARGNIIEIDFTKFQEVEIVRDLFGSLYDLNQLFQRHLSVGSTPILSVDSLRSYSNDRIGSSFNQMDDIARSLKDSSKMLVLDSGDKLGFPSLHGPDLIAMKDFILSQICAVTGLPLSFVGIVISGSLIDSGGRDEKQLHFALKRYFVEILKPILDQLFNLNSSISFIDAKNIQNILNTIDDIEGSSLNKEQKQKLKSHLLSFI